MKVYCEREVYVVLQFFLVFFYEGCRSTFMLSAEIFLPTQLHHHLLIPACMIYDRYNMIVSILFVKCE